MIPKQEDWITERGVPDGYEPVWPNDPKATHAICGCERHILVLKDDDSHSCVWLFLLKK
jgi:hypothetical protein